MCTWRRQPLSSRRRTMSVECECDVPRPDTRAGDDSKRNDWVGANHLLRDAFHEATVSRAPGVGATLM